MSNPTLEELFEEICCRWLSKNGGLSVRGEQGVFSYAAVVWLGIQQRLGGGSLQAALSALVERMKAGGMEFLFSRASRKLRDFDVSLNTGGASRARDRLPEQLVSELYDTATANIEEKFRSLDFGRPVYLLDGQVTAIARTESNLEVFGHTGNGEGELHYPRIRLVAAHKLSTAISTNVAIGTWRDSEVKLARDLFSQLPKDALLIMDRGFHKPTFLEAARDAGIHILVRLKDSKGSKLLGACAAEQGSRIIEWASKAQDGHVVVLHGKIIKFTSQVKGFRSSTFHFFTSDTSLGIEEVANFYRQRVKIEVFIRDIKQTLKLFFIRAKKAENVKKEIMLAYLTFNLVRAIMYDTAIATNTDPHRLSFKATILVCKAYADSFLKGKEPFDILIAQFRKHMLQTKLPLRKTPRSYPRELKYPRDRYPSAGIVKNVNTEKGK
jgi:hypothetical protein